MAQQLAVMVSLVGLAMAGAFLVTRRLRKRKRAIPPDHGAFVARFQILPPPPPPPPAAPLPLTGMTFAVKDIFDVKGQVTGFGNPTWFETHEEASETAPCVEDVIAAGATLEGKTHMDDMAFSMLGVSSLLGTPVNPAAPDHLPGGSSSGSAVAVAAGLVDFALGTDTAGSVRVPAANCGVLGFRPTHGSISTAGVVPMAPSLDTVGVLARDAGVLRQVGHILLHQPFMSTRVPLRVIIADDLFDLSACPRAPVTESLIRVAEHNIGPIIKYCKVGELLAAQVPSLSAFLRPAREDSALNGVPNGEPAKAGSHGGGPTGLEHLKALVEAQRALQRVEFCECHGAWVAANSPKLHPHVAQRVLDAAAAASATECAEPTKEEQLSIKKAAAKVKEELRQALSEMLKNDALLALPVTPDLPLRCDASTRALDEYRSRAMLLVAVSSMSGLPQVVIPMGTERSRSWGGVELPLAMSFIARSGADRFLLDATMLFAPALPQAFQEMVVARRPKAASAGSGASGATPGGQGGDKEVAPVVQQTRAPKSAAEVAKDNGNAAFKEKRFQDAIDFYTQAIKLDPGNATYYSNRAMAHLHLNNMAQVEADCTAALKLDRKNVKAMLRRGTAREFMGFYMEAYQDFQEALVLEPTNKTAQDAVRRIRESGVI